MDEVVGTFEIPAQPPEHPQSQSVDRWGRVSGKVTG